MAEYMHRVRVLRHGEVISIVDIQDREVAIQWAYDEMRLQTDLDVDGVLYAAVIEQGQLFVDPYGNAPDLFLSSKTSREGLVLDVRILDKVDHKFLFGIS
jgi:hypothetical protein